MPVYNYRCQECGEEFTKIRNISARDKQIKCPGCGSHKKKKRLIPKMTIHFKGGGFYKTDNKK